MSNTLLHQFVSGKADDPDTTLVRPSNWNHEHVFSGGIQGALLTRTSGESDGAQWTDGNAIWDQGLNQLRVTSLRFQAITGLTGVSLVAPFAPTGNHAWTLPTTLGAAGTVLTNNGAGVLEWTLPPGGGPIGSGVTGQVALWTTPTTLGGDPKLLWSPTSPPASTAPVFAQPTNALLVGTVPLGTLTPGHLYVGLTAPSNAIGMQAIQAQVYQGAPGLAGLVTLGDDRVGVSSWVFRGTGAANPIYGANFGVVFNTPGVANGLEIDVQNDSATNVVGQALWLNGSTRADGPPGTVGHRANAILIDTQDGSKWERGILFKEGFVGGGATGSVLKHGIHFEQAMDADFIVIQPRVGTAANIAVKLTNPEFTVNRFEILNSGAIRVGDTMTGPAFPSYAFVEDQTSGMYMEGPSILGFSVSGTVPGSDPPVTAGIRRMTLGDALNLYPVTQTPDNTGTIRFWDQFSVHSVGLMAQDFIGNAFRIKLPNVPGTTGQCLVTSGPVGALGSEIETWSYGPCGSVTPGGGGTVTNTGSLIASALVLGGGGVDITSLGTLGLATQVLHGNAGGAPTWNAVSLETSVSGRLPLANLALAPAGTGVLLGRGSGGAGDWEIITLGANLTMTGTTLAAAAPGAGAPTTARYWTATADAALSAELNLGALATGLVLNTVSGGIGTPSAYAGTACVGQFVRSLDASGLATCAAVALATDVSGDLAFSSLAQGTALSVLGVAGNTTADLASIVAGTDGGVLRRVGTALGFGPVNLASSLAVSNRLPYGNLPAATAGSILVGRSSVGVGDLQEVTLGPGLTMSGTVLNVAGGVGDVVGPAGALDSEVALFSGATGKLVKRATGTGPARLTAGVLSTGLVSLAGDVTGDLPLSGVVPASAASLLLGRGGLAGAGDWQELTLGANLVLTGTVLSAGGGAPTTATYITATPAGTLPNAVVLGTLANGLLVNTTTTGVPTVYPGASCTNQFVRALSGSGVATCAPVGTADHADASVTFAKLQDITSARLLGRVTAATGDVEELTGTQATTLLDVFTSALKGLAPASAGGIVNFLRADGTWATPGGAGNVTAGTLTTNALVLGSGATAIASLASLGTTTTVLHGNAAGAPTFGAVSLTADVSGRLPYANLTAATAATRLFGRGASGAGDWEEIILGANLSITGTTLNAAAGGGGAPTTATYITKTPDATLVSEFALSTLASGYLLSATGTGDLSTQTATQLTASLDLFTSALKGLVPLSGGGTANFLRADGNWAAPGGGGNVTTGTLTANTLPKATGATAIANSLLTDNAAILTYGGASGTTAVRGAFTATTSQIALGTTNTTTITMAVLTADRIFTLPDAASNPVRPLTCGAGTFVSAIAGTGILTCSAPAVSGGTVTHTLGALTSNQLVLGNAVDDIKPLGAFGTTVTVLHGNAAGAPTWGAVALATDVSGRLLYANLTAPTAASRLLGRGDTGGDWQEITLGANLTLTGTVLSASAATGAPTSASYWTATAEAALSNETSLGALTTGLLLNTVAAGVGTPSAYAGAACTNQFVRALSASGVSTCASVALATDVTGLLPVSALPAHTGDVTSSAGSVVLTIAPDVVTFAKMQNIATARFLGRITTATGDPEEVTGTQATALLDLFTSPLKGLVPASGGGVTNFLRADGTWAVPAGGNVSAGGTLTLNQLVIGQGTSAVATLGTLGTATTVLHGNAGGAPTFGAVVLTTDVSGRLPYVNLTAATAASRLFGRTDASAGDWQEIVLGANLTMVGTTLNAAAGTGAPLTSTYWTSSADAALLNERNMGLLTTGLVLNTVAGAVGTPSAYGGTFCTAQFVRSLNASGIATCASIVNADLANSTITVAGTPNRVVVTGSPVALGGTVTLSGPQDIHTGAAPTFSTLTLTANANELILGTTNTTTVTMATLTAPRIFILPDANSNPVRPLTCGAGSFISAIASSGLITCTASAAISGSALANQVAFFTGPSTMGGSPEYLWDPAIKQLTLSTHPTGGGALPDGASWGLSQERHGLGMTTATNQFAVNIQASVAAPTGALVNYEKAALIVMARTNDPSTSLNLDIVGTDTRGIIASTNPLGRAWGLYADAVVLAGGNGLVVAGEFSVHNSGSDQPNVDTTTSKYNLHLTGEGSVTAGINFSTLAPAYHKGIFARPANFFVGATDHFIELEGAFTVRPDGATKIGALSTAPLTTVLSVAGTHINALATVRLENTNTGSNARTVLALVRNTPAAAMDDTFAVRQDFILRDTDAVDNINARFVVGRSGLDGTGTFQLQTAIGGVLGDRLVINALGQIFWFPTPTIGTFALAANGTRTTELQLYTQNNATSVGFVAPPTSTGNHMWRLPTTLGVANSVMLNDGAGNLSWVASSFAVGTTGTPGVNELAFFSFVGTNSTITSSPALSFNPANQFLTLSSAQLRLQATGTARQQLYFFTDDNVTAVGFRAPATATGLLLWNLPSTAGAAGSVLSNDGVGNLSWAPAGAGAVTTTGTPAANQMTFMTGAATISSSPNMSFAGNVLSLIGTGEVHVGLTPFGGQAAGPVKATVSNSDNALPYQALLGQLVNGSSAGVGAATTANDKVAVSGWAHRGAGGSSPIYGGNFTVNFDTVGVAVGLELGVINSSGTHGIGNGLWVNGGVGGAGGNRDNAILIDTQDVTKWNAGIRFTEGNTGLGATGSINQFGIIFDKSHDADFIVIRPRVGAGNIAIRITDPTFAVNRFVVTNLGDITAGGNVTLTNLTGAALRLVTVSPTGVLGAAAIVAGFTGTKTMSAGCQMTFSSGIMTSSTCA